MRNYIFDTNFFFNLEIKSDFGDNPKEIFVLVSQYAHKLRASGLAECYVPPRILDEIETFIDLRQDYIQNFLAEVTVKAPDKSKVQLNTDVVYSLVQEIRDRSYRGLQVAEEEMGIAVKAMQGTNSDTSRPEYQKKIGEHIKKLRDRYRNATRVKFLDSVADLDVIVLAKELDGAVVSADEGVLLWSRACGVREVVPHVLRQEFDSLLQA